MAPSSVYHAYMTTAFTTQSEKKPVLVRIPKDLFDSLLVLSANETVVRGRSLSVPALIVELLSERMKDRSDAL